MVQERRSAAFGLPPKQGIMSAYGGKLSSKRRSTFAGPDGGNFQLKELQYDTFGKTGVAEKWWGTQEISAVKPRPRFDKIAVQYRPHETGSIWAKRTLGDQEGPKFGCMYDADQLVSVPEPRYDHYKSTDPDHGYSETRYNGMSVSTTNCPVYKVYAQWRPPVY